MPVGQGIGTVQLAQPWNGVVVGVGVCVVVTAGWVVDGEMVLRVDKHP